MEPQKNYIAQLAEYILNNLTKGYTPDSLKFSLLDQGYSEISIERAMEIANKELSKSAPQMKEKPQITYRIVDPDSAIKISREKTFFDKFLGK